MKPFARPLGLALLLLAAYVVAYNGDIDGKLDFFHEGERLAHMDKLWSGALPFRDIYVQHGLGEDILKPALACELWGHYFASLRRLGQNTYPYRGYLPPVGLVATLLALFALTRSATIIAGTALVLMSCWYEITDRHALVMLAVACTGCFLHSRRSFWLSIAGLLSSLSVLHSLDSGLYCGAAILAWLAIESLFFPERRSWRNLGFFVAGAGPPLIVFLIWCGLHGITSDFFYNCYCQLCMRSAVMSTPYPALSLDAGPWMFVQRVVLYYLVPLLLTTGILVSIRQLRRSPTSQFLAVLLAALQGFAFWISVWARPDIWHVAYAVGPFVLFAATLVHATSVLPHRHSVRIAFLVPLAICLATMLAIGNGGVLGRWVGRAGEFLSSHRRDAIPDLVTCSIPRLEGVCIDRAQAGFVTAIVNYIHQHSRPDETILDLSDFGLLYFLAERQSPSRFDLVFHVGHSPLRAEMAREILSREALPAVVIRPDGPLSPDDVLDAIVGRYYVSDAKIGSLELLLCRDPRAHRTHP